MLGWQISIWKDDEHYMSLGKGKLKQQWDSTTHPLESKLQNQHHQTWEKTWNNRNCHSLLVTMQMAQPFCKTAWWLLTKHTLTIWFNNHAPWYYPKKLKTCDYTKTYTWMFMIVLFIISQTWKQSKCPSVGEYINQLWYSWTVKYYSVLRRNIYFLDLFIGKGYNGDQHCWLPSSYPWSIFQIIFL